MCLSVSTNANVTVKVGNLHINNTRCEKHLGIKFDQRLTFDDHISDMQDG